MKAASTANSTTLGSPLHRAPRAVLAWLMWGATALFVLFQFFLQLSSGEIVDGLMKSFSLSAFGGGVLASTYYYVYVALQVPAGAMIDRFGPRRLLTMGALICALGCFLFGSSHFLSVVIVGRLLMGTGAAFAFVGSLDVIGKWFREDQFAFMAAIAETVGMSGTIIGGFFLADWVQRMGWHHSMIAAAGIAAVISGLIWLIVRDGPSGAIPVPVQSAKMLWRDFYLLIKNAKAWINGIYSGLMFSIVTVFVALWAIPYMELTHHLSLLTASMVCNLVFIGIGIAGPVIGRLDRRIPRRRPLLITCSFVSAALMTIVIYAPQLPLMVVMGLMMLLGVFASGYVLTFGIANEIVPPHMRGTSLGFTNALSVGTAPLLQPLVGLILHLTARHSTDTEYYTIHDYQMALIVLPLLILAAGILAMWMPNRKLT
ncbi:MFS transporter [Coxiella burnetii]|uniref:MFS transporter n=1 Tax=Coxiella burnetii TaxID=777 RepID=UPI0003A11830|nr:MFS transporter [Coxiella burnetii]AML48749.1 MFS transporter [Coxiella burnetii]AML54719.1 MFS transporter [Coxiella burnetii]ATN68684.1 MFS transporter [Coxiella burnetii]ATN70610.1 MFS transporter [Coxiella burnetii]ATN72535.1 MFS transporter [Coxiella burnetii]